MAYAAVQLPSRTVRARSSTRGLCAPSSASQADTVLTIPSADTRTVRPWWRQSVSWYVVAGQLLTLHQAG